MQKAGFADPAAGAGHEGDDVGGELSYEIQPTGTMYDQLKFPGESQIEDLFPNIGRKDNEGDASGQ